MKSITKNLILDLRLGDIDIGSYVKPISQEEANIEKMLSELKEANLESEKYFVRDLENRLISTKYSPINLSFLEMSSKLKVNESKFKGELTVPRFTVYDFYGSNEFSISFLGDIPSTTTIKFPYFKNLNLQKYFLKLYQNEGFDVKKSHLSDSGIEINHKGKERNSPYDRIDIKTQFIGLIPSQIKENVNESKEYFDGNEIYLIMETRPEQWNVEFIANDPLIIGTKNDEAYLINHFNTTNLENLLKDLFKDNHTINNLN